MIVLPNIGSSGLGTKSVNGRSLVPNPAPSTNAVRMRGAMNGLQSREGVRGVQEVRGVQGEESGARIQEVCLVVETDFSHLLCGTHDFRFSRKADAGAKTPPDSWLLSSNSLNSLNSLNSSNSLFPMRFDM